LRSQERFLKNGGSLGTEHSNEKWKIVIDTNVFYHILKGKKSVFSLLDEIVDGPYELCVTDAVKKELINLRESNIGKKKLGARLGLRLLEKFSIVSTPCTSADESIVWFAKSYPKTIVVTGDKALRKTLKTHGLRVASLSKDGRIVFN